MAHTPAVAGLKWRFLNGLQTPKNPMASVQPLRTNETVLPALPIVMAGPLCWRIALLLQQLCAPIGPTLWPTRSTPGHPLRKLAKGKNKYFRFAGKYREF